MTTSATCAGCGAPLPAQRPGVYCAGCLLRGALTPLPAAAPEEVAPGACGPRAPLRVGDYELLEPIACGGMGSVWRARQVSANRLVAYKTVASGLLASSAERRRFQTEIETAAQLDHPNIVPIYEVGDDDGRPFFTMRLMEGGTLARQMRSAECGARDKEDEVRNPGAATPPSAFRLPHLIKVARAVHFAHQRGILHRDLKPGNILLDAAGEPYVADFGLARRLELDNSLTLGGDLLGTPAYLAPEVARDGSRAATTAADIYSLGAILYELLTGQPPFTAPTVPELLRRLTEDDPVPLRVLRRKSAQPGATSSGRDSDAEGTPEPPIRTSDFGSRISDLDLICLQCLAKNPAARYPTAAALADDLERWQRGEPVQARAPSLLESSLRWAKKHRIAAAAFVVAAILPAVIITSLLWVNAHTRREREETSRQLYAADMLLADRALREGHPGLARSVLAAYLPERGVPGGRTQGALRRMDDLRGFEWRWLWSQSRGDQLRVLAGFPRPPAAVAVSPDGATLAIAGQEFLWRWQLDETNGIELLPPRESRWLRPEEAARLISRLHGTPWPADQEAGLYHDPGRLAFMVNPDRIGEVTGLSLSPDGRRVLSSDRTGFRCARVWRLEDGALEFAIPALFPHAVWSPAGNVVAIGIRAHVGPGRSGGLKLFDLDQCRELWSLPEAGGLAAFSADGRHLASGGCNDGQGRGWLHLWSVAEHRLVRSYRTRESCTELALSADGQWMAAAHAGSSLIELWQVDDEVPRELRGHQGGIRALAFAPDGRTLASAGADQLVRRWAVPDGAELPPLRGHTDLISGLGWLPDGERLVTASRDGTVRLWPAAPPAPETVHFYAGLAHRVLTSPDGRWWTGSHRHQASLMAWDAAADFARSDCPAAPGCNLGFDSGEGTLLRLASAATQDGLRVDWHRAGDFATFRSVELAGAGEWFGLAYAPAASLLAMGQTNGWVRVFDPRTGALYRAVAVPDPHSQRPTLGHPVELVALSPDGHWLAAGRPGSSQIALFSLPANRLRHCLQVQPLFRVVDTRVDAGSLLWIEFSPDGRMLASTAANEPGVRLWDVRAGRELGRLAGHRDRTVQVAFAPDGRTLATVGGDGAVKLWHLPTLRETATLLEGGALGPLSFSPDGRLLLVVLVNEPARLFRAPFDGRA